MFIPMFERFAKDPSRWVRNGAYEVLGAFIHLLGPELVTADFLRWYTGVPTLSAAMVDTEATYFCAFNFPAVCITLGAARFPELVGTFQALVRDSKFHVRRTMAHSLHEVARIVGPVHTVTHVVPAVDMFLADLPEVKAGVVKTLGHLLKHMPDLKRLEYIKAITDVAHNIESWRFRDLIADQLDLLPSLFSAEVVANQLVPVLFHLLSDRVAVVRNNAARHVCFLLP